MTCILCDTAHNVERRFIIPRHRNADEGATAKPICERCHDQFHWRASNVAKRKSQIEPGSVKSPGYGYRVVNGRIIPVPEQIETIERIIELRNAGRSWNGISDTLDREHRPTARGGRWYPQTVISIYRRECPEQVLEPRMSTPGWSKSRYGWTMDDGELVHDESEQKILRWMLGQRDAGVGYTEIAATLNDNDVPAKRGGIWYPASVSYIVRRERRQ